MNESDLLSIVNNHRSKASGSYYTELSEQRADAMEAYYQKPYGNETEGKSTVVTSEVADTVEWFMPSLMKVFTAGGQIARFDPHTPEDIQAARQETDAVNYYFFKKMDGFNVLYSFFKDALLQKNGVVKVSYNDKKIVTEETYENLTDDEFTLMASDKELDPTSYEPDEETGLITAVFTRTVDESSPLAEVVPPEEFYINPEYEHLSLEDTPFCAHEYELTASDLIQMGYDKSIVDELKGGSTDTNEQWEEKSARFADLNGSYGEDEDDDEGDESRRSITLTDSYIKVDYDGDGISELRHVVIANGVEVLENEAVDDVPFVSITPVPMPHRFNGRSIADQTMDIQLQKTTLIRNILDNLYLINNQRTIVLEGGANLDDLLVSRAGGIAREFVKDAIRPFPTTPFSGHPYEMLEYFDGMKEARTGITKYNQGLDANSLNKTASGMGMIMDASQSRIELVTRLFAAGVAKVMSSLHGIMLRNMDKDLILQLRGGFVSVNPADWNARTAMTVTVGLGTSDDTLMLERLKELLVVQKEMQGLGFVTPEHLHNTLARMVESMGLRNVEEFFLNPDQAQPPPPQPDPQMEMIKGQMQTATEANQINREDNNLKHKEGMAKIDAQLAIASDQSEQKKRSEMTKLTIASEQLEQKKMSDMAKNTFDLTKLEVDTATNIPGSVV